MPNPADPQSFNRYSYGLNNPLRYTDPSGHSYVNFDNSVECPIEHCGINPYESENGQYQGEDLYENYSYEEVTMMQLFWMDTRGGDSALREGLYNELNYIARNEYDECGPWCSTYTDEGRLYFDTGLDPDFLAGLASSAAAMVTGVRPGDPTSSPSPSNYSFVSTSKGRLVRVPADWLPRVADNGHGIVYQRPGATGNAHMSRIMEPTSRYPHGYVRYYNALGQPLDVMGKPGSRASTHIPLDYTGSIPGWP